MFNVQFTLEDTWYIIFYFKCCKYKQYVFAMCPLLEKNENIVTAPNKLKLIVA